MHTGPEAIPGPLCWPSEVLRDWLNPQLGRHERVDEVLIRLTMPKTMIGKVSRTDLIAEKMAQGSEMRCPT